MMTNRTNRVAWLLVVVLAAALVGGCGMLSYYRFVTLLPRDEWGFGRMEVMQGYIGAPQSEWRLVEHRYVLGVVAFRWK